MPHLMFFIFCWLGSSAMALECYLGTNTTRLTELPRMVSCECGHSTETFNMRDNILERFNSDLVGHIDSISIVGCQSLLLNLTASPATTKIRHPIDFELENVTSLQLIIDKEEPSVRHIFMQSVATAEATIARDEYASESEGLFSMEEIYFYSTVGLGALLLLTWVSIPLALCFSRRGRCSRCLCCHCCMNPRRNKRVSRAESWRYESNIYVNPGQRQQQQRFNTSAALHQMLPYQLVAQREATTALLSSPTPSQQNHYTSSSQQSSRGKTLLPPLEEEMQNYEQQDLLMGRTPLLATLDSDKSMTVNTAQYTDTSLQFVDDDDAELDEVDDGGGINEEEEESNANSASYGSRNQATTLPLEQSEQSRDNLQTSSPIIRRPVPIQ